MRRLSQRKSSLFAFLTDQRGAIGIILTIMLPVFVGFITLAVDAGHVYQVKSELQNAADAAALAGDQLVGTYVVGAYSSNPATPCTSSSPPPLCASAKKLAGSGSTTSTPRGRLAAE